MPNRRWIHRYGLSASALVLLAGAMSPANGQTLVKAAPNSEEVKASHGRTWVAFPDVLFTIRMDKDGKVTGTAAPISVAHEEQGDAFCAGVRSVAALSSKGSAMVTFTPSPRCSFSASEATLVLPLDSIGKFAAICNETTPPPTGASAPPAPPFPTPATPAPLLPAVPVNVRPAWRRAEGWSGRVPFYGAAHVTVGYDRYPPDDAKAVGEPGVLVTCDKVPCTSWLPAVDQNGYRRLPDAFTGKPYRVRLFAGAKPPITFDTAVVPAGLSMGQDGYLSGTPTQMASAYPKIAFTESYACPWNGWTLAKGVNSHWSAMFLLSVKDGEPPAIAAFTMSPDTLPAGGGDVLVTLQLTDKDRVEKVLSTRSGPNANHSAAMTLSAGNAQNGTWKITWPVPANTTQSPVLYTVKAWAVDGTNNVVNATPKTVVVQAAGQAPPSIPRPRP